jgi:hypothetical protein
MLEALVHRKQDGVRSRGPMAPHLETFADTLTARGTPRRLSGTWIRGPIRYFQPRIGGGIGQ